MYFGDIADLKAAGFGGFWTVGQLRHMDWLMVPDVPGVYMAIWTDDYLEFLEESTAGWFKGKNPSVDVSILYDRWQPQSIVMYIGKAGGNGHKATLRTRLHQFLQFGSGARCAHWGGRYVWQIVDSDSLKLCWLPTPDDEPALVERQLIAAYKSQNNGLRPFANLRD